MLKYRSYGRKHVRPSSLCKGSIFMLKGIPFKPRSISSAHTCFRAVPLLFPIFAPLKLSPPSHHVSNPKGPKHLYGTKYGFCSSNFPYGLGKYSPYGYLGPFGQAGGEQVEDLACQGDFSTPRTRSYTP